MSKQRSLKPETIAVLERHLGPHPKEIRWVDVKAAWGERYDPRLVGLARAYAYHRTAAESGFAELKRHEPDLVSYHARQFEERSTVFKEVAHAAFLAGDNELFKQIDEIMAAVTAGPKTEDERVRGIVHAYWQLTFVSGEGYVDAPTLQAVVDQVDRDGAWGLGPEPQDKRRTVRDFLERRSLPYASDDKRKGASSEKQ